MNDTDRPEKLTEIHVTPEERALIEAYRTDPGVHKFLDVFLRPEDDENEDDIIFFRNNFP